MKKYIQYNGDIYDIYLDYMSPQDIHVYSIDESFLDVTDYLKMYKKTPRQFAKLLINEIAERTHIPATVGMGSNLYLAKVALDITAKKKADHIGWLNEDLYQETLWKHRPLTDFWQIGKGIERRLAKYGIHDMEGITRTDERLLYKEFGINAELLIDHAWGRESCTIADIKAHKTKGKSIFGSQILFEDYSFEKAQIVVKEMALDVCHKMMRQKVVTNSVTIFVGYSKDVIPPSGGTAKLLSTTHLYSEIIGEVMSVFECSTSSNMAIRRIGLSYNNLVGERREGYYLFTNFAAIEKEKKAEQAVLSLKDRFGKNCIIRAVDLEEGATAMQRNKLIGGHNE
jgi:DNA polymerase V